MTNTQPTTDSSAEDESPFMTWRDLPVALIALPFLLLLGVHVAGIAMLLRRWSTIPYVIWMVLLYSGLLTPLVISNSENAFCLTLTAVVLVQLSLVAAVVAFDDWRDGNNFEMVAIPHFLTVVAYLLVPAVSTARNHV
jgi:hypothetical protein